MSERTERTGKSTERSGEADRSAWETYFPYDSPYSAQRDGIKGVIETARKGRFAAMEGECGTGKTLIALTAGAELIRNPNTRYQRLFATTGVKQQLEAFVDDTRAINENLPGDIDALSGIQAVGKGDVCSWVDEGTLSQRGIYSTCNRLQDPIWSKIGREQRLANDDRGKESALRTLVEDKQVKRDSEWPPAVSGDEWTAPIRDEHDLRDDDDYCAFYANHLLHEEEDSTPFTFDGLLDTQDIIERASSAGVCPHATLGNLLADVEIVIGNYRHVFDRRTRNFTEEIIDESTFAVFDEAHTMEGKVRQMLNLDAGLSDFASTLEETTEIIHILESSNPEDIGLRNAFNDELRRWGVQKDDLHTFQRIVRDAAMWLSDAAETALDTRGYQLRDPEETRTDKFEQWIKSREIAEDCLRAEYIGEAIRRARDAAAQVVEDYPRESTAADSVGQLLSAWVRRNTGDNYQSLELEQVDYRINTHDRVATTFTGNWNGSFDPHLVLENCLPRQLIGNTLSEFGGGLLMSATLAPIEAYETAVGLDRIGTTSGARGVSGPTPGDEDEDGDEDEEDDANESAEQQEQGEDDRYVYGMHFPQENRTSMAVDLPKFTYSNRKKPESAEGRATRKQYARVLRDAVNGVNGNVLVAMPSYEEAKWAASALRGEWGGFEPPMQKAMKNTVDKPIIVDESSSNEETQHLKEEFFSGRSKVLTTSLRGTLTEGVDFSGEKLKGCVVCGVPIREIGSDHATAIQTAYGRAFGGNGFEHAFSIPAVRKARQALGRVIRSDSDVGVRVLVDHRYTQMDEWGAVRKHIPEHAREEYECVTPEEVSEKIARSPVGTE